ncbi:MAG: hypothetical protein KAJ91_02225 [Candidatus Aenigmarchaeota archaeon]|nr:hypothetical protein [Candidatus Aenigmarchaeota archaeon]MCK5333278.1 hypothetical protein [Candidatus Aenigmarchaeota archaeon]
MIFDTALETELVNKYHQDCKFSPNMDFGEIHVNEAGLYRGHTVYEVALRGEYHTRLYCVTETENGSNISSVTLFSVIKNSVSDITSFLSGKHSDNAA